VGPGGGARGGRVAAVGVTVRERYDVYLFDIDGTLLVCRDAVHYFGFCHVLSDIARRPLNLEGVVAHGNVDNGILRDALLLAGVEESAWRPRLAEMQERLCAHVEAHAAELVVERLDGVREVLEHLRRRGALLGVATGNLERIGWAKLVACGLRECFDFGAFSDAWESRAEVFQAALASAREKRGEGCAVCVVGDTPADVHAARANGVDVIAVATGVYGEQELREAGPTRLVRSMRELLL
jgi:phosphoglycolate phosphatase